MPSVASEAPALKPAVLPTPRVSAASNSGGVSSFESLLDETSQTPASPSPSPTKADQPAAASSDPAAKTDPTAKTTGTSDAASAGKDTASSTVTANAEDQATAASAATSGASTAQSVAKGTPDASAGNTASSENADSAANTANENTGIQSAADQVAAELQANAASGDGKSVTQKTTDGDAKVSDETGIKGQGKDDKDKSDDASQAANDSTLQASAADQLLSAGTNAAPAAAAPTAATAAISDAPAASQSAVQGIAVAANDNSAAKLKSPELPQTEAATSAAGSQTDGDGKTTAAQAGGTQQAADAGKEAKPASTSAALANLHQHAAGPDAQPTLNPGAHATPNAADILAPPMAAGQAGAPITQSLGGSPAQSLPQLPQAVAVPLSGVAIDIAGKALAGKNHFEIRLDPPELGRVEVRLDVDKDGRVTSHVIADRKDTLALLQRDASGLQRAFQDAGLKTADNGLQFSLRDQSAGQQQNSGADPNSAKPVAEDDALAPIETPTSSYSRLARLNGGLDIRV